MCCRGLWALRGNLAMSLVSLFLVSILWKSRSHVFIVTFSIPKHTETILVLSQSDDRFYSSIASAAKWSFDFKLFKVGSKEVVGSSTHSIAPARSVMMRLELSPGDYVVQVRSTPFTE